MYYLPEKLARSLHQYIFYVYVLGRVTLPGRAHGVHRNVGALH